MHSAQFTMEQIPLKEIALKLEENTKILEKMYILLLFEIPSNMNCQVT